MKINAIGVSGGKDSSALLLWSLFRSGYDKDTLRFTFCDTGNEHQFTYDHIALLDAFSRHHGGPAIEVLKPDLNFYELALKKRRFPSARARFCTQELKIFPTQDWVEKQIKAGYDILAHSGVRADESLRRAGLQENDINGMLMVPEYRPLLRWKFDDVIAIHKEHGLPLNKLYSYGARRVGCFPCIMSRKSEILNIALNFPERIKLIADCEREFQNRYGRCSTFFAADKVPTRFRKHTFCGKDGVLHDVATIDDVVAWAKTTGRHCEGRYDDPKLFDVDDEAPASCESGFCE